MLEAPTQMKNGTQLEIPLLKLVVMFFAFKIQRDKVLILSFSESSPSGFDSFEILPSIGASGGIITAQKSSVFSGQLVFQNNYAITARLTAKHNRDFWLLTNVYGPYTHDGKRDFIQWLKHYNISDDENWLLVGDFNLLRKPENRNKPGGDVNEMLFFNEAISYLGLIELPLFGRRYTQTNKQMSPLMEILDWFFTSNSWTSTYIMILLSVLL